VHFDAGLNVSPIRYVYNEAASLASGVPAQSQLTSIVWQNGSVRRYHHEEQSHHNIYKANQNPNNCQCFWQSQGAVPEGGLPAGSIPIEQFAN
jgi:hypothetical protein